VAICGGGNRSRLVWQRHARDLDGFELVGVQDISPQSLKLALAMGTVGPEQCYADLDEMLAETQPDALIVCPVHAAHAQAVEAGLRSGAHVLVEKPFTTELSDAVRLVDLAERNGLVLGVVQNWRSKSVGQVLRRAIADGMIGQVSHIFFRYLRDREQHHLPGYLFEEPDPLLNAMAVHHFDLFRYILGQELVLVEGHAFRPSWSRYRHQSSMQLWMETEGGVRISYVATLSSRNGQLPMESLQVEGELGTLFNESEYSEPPLWLLRGASSKVDLTSDVEVRDSAGQYTLADVAILRNFRAAIIEGKPLIAPARDNLATLSTLEAARECFRHGRAVNPQELLTEARRMVAEVTNR
jgi:predicted dehydrogenase